MFLEHLSLFGLRFINWGPKSEKKCSKPRVFTYKCMSKNGRPGFSKNDEMSFKTADRVLARIDFWTTFSLLVIFVVDFGFGYPPHF